MAYSTPRTWVAGEIATAANLNTYLRDNVAWLATDSPACHAYRSTTQSLANDTYTAISANTEFYDNANMHSGVTNTSRITIPSDGDGKYLVGGNGFTAASTAGTYRYLGIGLNASLIATSFFPLATSDTGAVVTTTKALVSGDYVELYMQQNSGGALAAKGQQATGPDFFAYWFRN